MRTAGAAQKVRGQRDHTRWTQTVGATIPATKNWTVARLPVAIWVTRKGTSWKESFWYTWVHVYTCSYLCYPAAVSHSLCCEIEAHLLLILTHLNKPGSSLSWMARFMRATRTWGGVCLYSTFTYFIVLWTYLCYTVMNISLRSADDAIATFRNSWQFSGLCGRVG